MHDPNDDRLAAAFVACVTAERRQRLDRRGRWVQIAGGVFFAIGGVAAGAAINHPLLALDFAVPIALLLGGGPSGASVILTAVLIFGFDAAPEAPRLAGAFGWHLAGWLLILALPIGPAPLVRSMSVNIDRSARRLFGRLRRVPLTTD